MSVKCERPTTDRSPRTPVLIFCSNEVMALFASAGPKLRSSLSADITFASLTVF